MNLNQISERLLQIHLELTKLPLEDETLCTAQLKTRIAKRWRLHHERAMLLKERKRLMGEEEAEDEV